MYIDKDDIDHLGICEPVARVRECSELLQLGVNVVGLDVEDGVGEHLPGVEDHVDAHATNLIPVISKYPQHARHCPPQP